MRITAFLKGLIREAGLSAINQRAASIITAGVVMASVLAVLLTTGRTVGAEHAVLSSIDSASIRTVIYTIEGQPIPANTVQKVAAIEQVDWVAGFGIVQETKNQYNPDSKTVFTRDVYTTDFAPFGITKITQSDLQNVPVGSQRAYVSEAAKKDLGLPEVGGGILDSSGMVYPVAGTLIMPTFLEFTPSQALIPRPMTAEQKIFQLVVTVENPEDLALVTKTVYTMLDVSENTKVKVRSGEEAGKLRAVVEDSMSGYSRQLVLGVLAVMTLLEMAILYGFVLLRRKDFGRRRALGASRPLIVALVLTQTALLAIFGATIGVVVSTVISLATQSPLPPPDFTIATWVLVVGSGIISALIPAIVASRRDPITELRVP